MLTDLKMTSDMEIAVHSNRKKPTVMVIEKWLVAVVPNTTSCKQCTGE
jgi:hypothetical protein